MRILLFVILLGSFLIFGYEKIKDFYIEYNDSVSSTYKLPIANNPSMRYYLPKGSEGQLIHHKFFSLSYNEKNEQADWVAYELSEEMLKKPNLDRPDRFNPDYDVITRSAFHRDYSNTGFTRGHLVPAADMSWDDEAQKETFLMSNISPQPKGFNGGIWKELEENVRDWTYHNDRLYITSGPLFLGGSQTIGVNNKIKVPSHFFKALMDIDGKTQKSIAFIIPNNKSELKLEEYATTVDDIELKTGFDLFPDLVTEEIESKIESNFDLRDWKFSEKRYDLRIRKWNYQ